MRNLLFRRPSQLCHSDATERQPLNLVIPTRERQLRTLSFRRASVSEPGGICFSQPLSFRPKPERTRRRAEESLPQLSLPSGAPLLDGFARSGGTRPGGLYTPAIIMGMAVAKTSRKRLSATSAPTRKGSPTRLQGRDLRRALEELRDTKSETRAQELKRAITDSICGA